MNVRQRGHRVNLVTTLRNVIMLACAGTQDSAQLGLDGSMTTLFYMHKEIAAYGKRAPYQTIAYKIYGWLTSYRRNS